MEQSSLFKMLGVECVILVHTVSIIFAINVFLPNILIIMFKGHILTIPETYGNCSCVSVWLRLQNPWTVITWVRVQTYLT